MAQVHEQWTQLIEGGDFEFFLTGLSMYQHPDRIRRFDRCALRAWLTPQCARSFWWHQETVRLWSRLRRVWNAAEFSDMFQTMLRTLPDFFRTPTWKYDNQLLFSDSRSRKIHIHKLWLVENTEISKNKCIVQGKAWVFTHLRRHRATFAKERMPPELI